VLINVEFDTAEEKNTFIKPSYALVEVTQEPWAAGGMLAGKSYTDIMPSLHKDGYVALKHS
jgi:hypothetical protein